MARRITISAGLLSTLALALVLAMFLLAVPAAAHHKEGHDKGGGSEQTEDSGTSEGKDKGDKDGDADDDPDTEYTEDNDTNDGGTPNNQPDEGDNEHPSGKDKSEEKGNSGNQGNSESDPDDNGKGPDRSNGGPDKPNGSGGDDLADQDGNNGCGNDDDFEDDNEGWCGNKPEKPEKVKEHESKEQEQLCPHADTMAEREDCKKELAVDVLADSSGCPMFMPFLAGCDRSDDIPAVGGLHCADGSMTDGNLCVVLSGQAWAGSEAEGDKLAAAPNSQNDVQGGTDARVLGEQITRGAPDDVAADTTGAALPFTGAGVTFIAIVGLALILAGLWFSRSRSRI